MHENEIIHRDLKPENIIFHNVTFFFISGYDKAVRFRMVNQFKNDEINLLWHSALRLALIAEKKELQ